MKNKILSFSIFENIEDVSRLSEEITEILNSQIGKELESSQIYRGMSCWLDNAGWNGAAKYYFKSAQEELTHMDKIYQYLFDRNALAIVPTCDEVEQEFDDIRNIVEKSLEHEMKISEDWEEIAELAKEEGDSTTFEFAQWFLKEQISEEDKFREILDKINLDLPKWRLDELFIDAKE